MNILVTGAGGFIGHHLVTKLKNDGHRVVAADWKYPEFEPSKADVFMHVDLRFKESTERAFESNGQFDEVYNLAANMGGMGFIESYKALIMRDSVLISTNVLEAARHYRAKRFFYSSSACIYNTDLQKDPDNPALSEDMAYPAKAEAGYGWEKLFTEMMCKHFMEDYGLETRVARFHNVYGPLGTWRGGREKAPAAMCRKVILSKDGGEMEMWGDGKQTRSFMFIDDCTEGILKIMRGDYPDPLNLGTDFLISINDLATLAMSFENKKLTIKHIKGPLGVRGRNSDNTLIKKVLNWTPSISYEVGVKKTYLWIKQEVEKARERGEKVDEASYLPDK